MIPLNAIPWRYVSYLLIAVALVVAGWRVHAWREAYKALPDVQAALEAERACVEPSECWRRLQAAVARHNAIAQEVQSNYERELADLRNRPPAPAVRLCRPAGGSAVHRPEPAGPANGAPASGELQVEVGADIGQQLFDLADAADAEALKLRHLQEWNRAISSGQ